jgi:hypothetical protein
MCGKSSKIGRLLFIPFRPKHGYLHFEQDCICFTPVVKQIDMTHYSSAKNLTTKIGFALLILAALIVNSCKTHFSKGIKKDFDTGLTSTYSNLEPEKVFLVMNNEVLNHTDIPLGESFLVINDNVKGLTVKNGKVSVGCLLQISDSTGKALLNEADLFAGNDLFNEVDVKQLKCTVNTGSPMKWEEKYKIKVKFWDKLGDGNIENIVTIRSIDIP